MDSADLAALQAARDWRRAGHGVRLYTVVETWGSAPRPPGAMLALRDDGALAGSVSGGCVEDDLVWRQRREPPAALPELLVYGVSRDEAARFGLPCGGTLRLLGESLATADWLDELLARCRAHERVMRCLDVGSGAVELRPAPRDAVLRWDGRTLCSVHGPRWRLLLIGAGQLSQCVATIAALLDFELLVCDPREEYGQEWSAPAVQRVPGMPDDAVLAIEADEHTAIVALTHDPKLDDMALLSALQSAAFYVGALGSRASTHARRERLALFELTPAEIARLHGPVGLPIGSRTPAEIAVSVMAEIVAERSALVRGGARTASCVASA